MEALASAVSHASEDTDAGCQRLQEAAETWALHALRRLRGETQRRALDVARTMTEFVAHVRHGAEGADDSQEPGR